MIFRSHLSRDFRGHVGISRELYMQRAGNCTVSAYVQAGNYTCSAQGNRTVSAYVQAGNCTGSAH